VTALISAAAAKERRNGMFSSAVYCFFIAASSGSGVAWLFCSFYEVLILMSGGCLINYCVETKRKRGFGIAYVSIRLVYVLSYIIIIMFSVLSRFVSTPSYWTKQSERGVNTAVLLLRVADVHRCWDLP
jgi:hypothetical protein